MKLLASMVAMIAVAQVRHFPCSPQVPLYTFFRIFRRDSAFCSLVCLETWGNQVNCSTYFFLSITMQIASASHDPLGERVTNAVRKASETGSQLRMHALGEAKSCTSSDVSGI